MATRIVKVNRAPVLTLWGAVVAERLGYARDTALTFGKCVAGLNAQSKGRSLGIFSEPKPAERGGTPKKRGLGEEFWIELCGRPIPAKNTADGAVKVCIDHNSAARGCDRAWHWARYLFPGDLSDQQNGQ